MNRQQVSLFILICLVLTTTLIISDLFVYKTLAGYFFFTILSCLFTGIAGILILFGKDLKQLNFSNPTVIFVTWCLFVIIHGMIIGWNSRYSYLVISFFFYLSLVITLKKFPSFLSWIFNAIVILAILESLVCIAQYLGIIGSLNRYFKVTGTHVNPNVTAMFLAMAPLFVFKFRSKHLLWFDYISILLVLVALLMLKCRTAWIGLLVSAVAFLFIRYDFAARIKLKSFRRTALIMLVIFSGLFFTVAVNMYHSKKASADGRKMVWKVTAQMIAEKPLIGIGYGNFEHNYNLLQAAYFSSGKATPEEIHNASFVRMAYNEPLENAAEGGLLGSGLFGAVLFSLLLYGWKHRPTGKFSPEERMVAASFAAITGFIAMSLVNFTIQAIPVFCVFLVYAAVLTTKAKESRITETNREGVFNYVLGAILLLSAIGFGIKQTELMKSHLKLKKASISMRQGKVGETEKALKYLAQSLKKSESYFQIYGNLFILKKDYSSAIIKLNQSLQYTSDPEIYSDLAWCYEQTGNLSEAEKNYTTSMNIEPSRFNPRYRLMLLNLMKEDTIGSIEWARSIVSMKPKIPTQEITYYKKEASKFLRQYAADDKSNLLDSQNLSIRNITPRTK